jgi:hypothetical protein
MRRTGSRQGSLAKRRPLVPSSEDSAGRGRPTSRRPAFDNQMRRRNLRGNGEIRLKSPLEGGDQAIRHGLRPRHTDRPTPPDRFSSAPINRALSLSCRRLRKPAAAWRGGWPGPGTRPARKTDAGPLERICRRGDRHQPPRRNAGTRNAATSLPRSSSPASSRRRNSCSAAESAVSCHSQSPSCLLDGLPPPASPASSA